MGSKHTESLSAWYNRSLNYLSRIESIGNLLANSAPFLCSEITTNRGPCLRRNPYAFLGSFVRAEGVQKKRQRPYAIRKTFFTSKKVPMSCGKRKQKRWIQKVGKSHYSDDLIFLDF